jgi:phenylpropionate dioxygenase-like ring-hydroxylating dioxygenase large terminal subunit
MNPPSRWWVPVSASEHLRAATPLAARALGEDLVLWRAAEGGPASAFVDRCPHRGARLSRGCVAAGLLECAYHGWRFEGGGRCVAVPALPGFAPPPTHRATAWPVLEQHGLCWVASPPPAGQMASPPTDELAGVPPRRVLCGPFDVAASAPRVVENFLDTAHFGFVHDGFLGSRASAEHLVVPDYRVEADALGRPTVPRYRAWQPRAGTAARGGAWVDYSYRVLGPWSALLTKKAEGAAPSEAYALWCNPLDDEHTRVWFTICTDDHAHDDDALREFQAIIFSQDAPVLESQRPRRLPLATDGAEAEKHCAADRLSVAYRRWLVATAALYGTC